MVHLLEGCRREAIVARNMPALGEQREVLASIELPDPLRIADCRVAVIHELRVAFRPSASREGVERVVNRL
jgi:hypothetical protein